jgi:hypothetical protein
MPINTLAYATLFMQELDKQIVAGATSGWMEGNAGLVIYNGGNTVKIPKISMDGLGNYDRSLGFTQGAATLAYETKTMGQDRGRTFMLDSMDVNETNFVANASNLMGEFQRTMVIPEIDAYRYSTIAQQAIANGRASGGYTPVVADILTKLRADIAAVQDVIGADKALVVTMSTATLNVLENSAEIVKQLNVGTFQAGVDLTYEVKKIDGVPILETPSARLKTNYAFFDGKTGGQIIGGFAPAGKAGVTIGDVRYDAAAVGTAGNAYTVTIVQGSGASVTTAGVVDGSGNLVITLGTTSGSVPLSVKASDIAALSFSGAGAALITATVLLGATVQVASAIKTMVGGAGAGAAAKSINWIICAVNSPIAISKTDNIRIFSPDQNQTADAWKLDYRKYHDLWIMDNKLPTIFVNVKESL